jgi:hypothetical protein
MAIPPLQGVSRAAREVRHPRTVLGFYAVLLGLVEAGVVAILVVLVSQQDLHYLVPWVIAFGALIFVAIIVVVVAMNMIDPTKLQLEPIKGQEFLDYQKVTRGDSIGGDYVEKKKPKRVYTEPVSLTEGETADEGDEVAVTEFAPIESGDISEEND